MMGVINTLYNLTLILLGTCVITTILTIGYVIGIIKYTEKYRLFTGELEKVKVDKTIHKENI
ncbi:hypothetical protein CBEIBR21_07225 [Clostridium beijerinckii]|uniref:Uncharacterized protein n=3 Tax=Clostridium TaxID=1485 RepID=A0A6L9EMJ5_CLOBU|nr:hypothetical protein [Clostridium butyricum]OOP74580.1 hypothetical protein CBEIBR21_07225 [Clostridium beijerinckii]